MDFIGFLFALYRDWVTLMSGIFSIFFTILGCIQPFKKPVYQRKIFWGMALFCFLLASVRVWTGEHQSVTRVELEINKLSIPNLNGTVENVLLCEAGKRKEGSILPVFATITNTGAQSIVKDFVIIVKIGNKQMKGFTLLPTSIMHLHGVGEKEGQELMLKSEDYLPNKCMDHPIVTGGGGGWVSYIFCPQCILGKN